MKKDDNIEKLFNKWYTIVQVYSICLACVWCL